MLSDGGEGQNRVINRKNNEKERRHEQTRQEGNDYLDKRQQGSGSSGSTECGEWTSGRVGAPLGREHLKDAASTGSMCWRMWWQGLGLAPGAVTERGQMAPTHRPREEPAQTETLGHEDARHERGFQKKQKGKRLKTAKHWRVQKIIDGCLKNLGEKNHNV